MSMRGTYHTLRVLAILAIIVSGVIFSLSFFIIFPADALFSPMSLESVTYPVSRGNWGAFAILEYLAVGMIALLARVIVWVPLALAITVAAWTSQRGWMRTFIWWYALSALAPIPFTALRTLFFDPDLMGHIGGTVYFLAVTAAFVPFCASIAVIICSDGLLWNRLTQTEIQSAPPLPTRDAAARALAKLARYTIIASVASAALLWVASSLLALTGPLTTLNSLNAIVQPILIELLPRIPGALIIVTVVAGVAVAG
jgi:hypothetical protein